MLTCCDTMVQKMMVETNILLQINWKYVNNYIIWKISCKFNGNVFFIYNIMITAALLSSDCGSVEILQCGSAHFLIYIHPSLQKPSLINCKLSTGHWNLQGTELWYFWDNLHTLWFLLASCWLDSSELWFQSLIWSIWKS